AFERAIGDTPEALHRAPQNLSVLRVDEVRAARQLRLSWKDLRESPAAAAPPGRWPRRPPLNLEAPSVLADTMKDRVRKVFGNLAAPADALVLANSVDPLIDHSFFYLFDCASGIFEGSLAIALPDGQLHVFSSPLEAESAYQAAKQDTSVTVHVPKPSEMEAEVRGILGGTQKIALHYH
ncbi:peptidase, M24 family, partial [mine drainage metagenome]